MKLSLTHKILLVVAIPLVIQLAFLFIVSQGLKNLAQTQSTELHHIKVLMARDELMIMERQRNLLFAIYQATLNPSCRVKFQEVRVESARVFRDLSQLWAGEPAKLRRLERAWRLNDQRDYMSDQVFPTLLVRAQNTMEMMGGLYQEVLLQKMLLSKKVPLLDDLIVQEEKDKENADQTIRSQTSTLDLQLWLGTGAVLLASLFSGLVFTLSISRRLKTTLSNIDSLIDSQTKLLNVAGEDEISQLNQAIVTTANKIRDAEEFQAQTIAVIADELNKPLTELDAALQELQIKGFEHLNDKGAKRLRDSGAEIKRLEGLVFELVNLDSTARPAETNEIDVADLATNCLRIVEPLAKLKSIKLNLSAGANSTAFGDSDRITQVLINLLSNAIKYSNDNSEVEVLIESEEAETPQRVKVSVIDRGVGIPEEFRSRIFKRFEQAETAGTAKPSSSGLGLKISKEIVEAQNGSMGFDSTVGAGTTFWFRLPTTPVEPERRAADEGATATKTQNWKATLWKKSLLIVALPMVVQLTTVFVLSNYLQKNSQNIAELQIIPRITYLHSALMSGIARGACFAMLYNAKENQEHLNGARSAIKEMFEDIVKLENVPVTDSNTKELDKRFIAVIKAHISLQKHLLEAPRNAPISSFIGEHGTDRVDTLWIDTLGFLKDLVVQQNALISSNTLTSDEIRHNIESFLFASAIAAAIMATALALITGRGLTNRARKISEEAMRFSHDRQLPDLPSGDDELAFLQLHLIDAGKKLIELEDIRAEMISLTSHELRTPLTSLMALLELIDAGVFGETTERGRELLAKARLEASELIVLITNLLDLEKMESGKMLVTKQQVDVRNVLDQIESDNAQTAELKGVELTVSHAERVIMADANRISQAVTAIIRSIIERVPSNSNISIECKERKHGVVLTVGAPHGIAAKGYRNKQREFARQDMAINLARLTARQHGGDLNVVTSSKGRTIELSIPA